MWPIGFAVIGAGAFGTNHLRVIRDLSAAPGAPVRLTAIVENDAARAHALESEFPGVRIFRDLDACLAARAAGEFAASRRIRVRAHECPRHHRRRAS